MCTVFSNRIRGSTVGTDAHSFTLATWLGDAPSLNFSPALLSCTNVPWGSMKLHIPWLSLTPAIVYEWGQCIPQVKVLIHFTLFFISVTCVHGTWWGVLGKWEFQTWYLLERTQRPWKVSVKSSDPSWVAEIRKSQGRLDDAPIC